MKLTLAATFLFTAFAHAAQPPTPVTGNFLTGNQLDEQMNGNSESREFALGYIIGQADAIQSGLARDTACMPGVIMGQVLKVVQKYMNDNPKNLNLPAANIVQWALSESFPCPK
jgi:hypothetical protein